MTDGYVQIASDLQTPDITIVPQSGKSNNILDDQRLPNQQRDAQVAAHSQSDATVADLSGSSQPFDQDEHPVITSVDQASGHGAESVTPSIIKSTQQLAGVRDYSADLGKNAPNFGSADDLETEGLLSKSQHFEIGRSSPIPGYSARGRQAPWIAWPMLVAAVLAVSCAAATFATFSGVPAMTLAAWRLQLTTILLSPFCCYQFAKLPADDKKRTFMSLGWMVLSGASLALHFSGWVWGIQHTSLTHAVLFISATPVLLAAGALVLGKPISAGELGGTAVGLVGTLILCLGGKSEGEVTIAGDMVTLLAAVAIIGYLFVGQRLRVWMPVFVYAVPVTGSAAFFCSLGAMVFEGVGLTRSGQLPGIFSWAEYKYLPRVAFLALVPGIVGHTGFNTLLRWLSPLVISLATCVEPLFGSIIGWAVNVMQAPGLWTYVGGSVLLVSTVVVTVASQVRVRSEHAKQAAISNVGQV